MSDRIHGGEQWARAVLGALEDRGWSRYRLAQEIGVDRWTCCRWLRDGVVPSAKHRAAVSVALEDARLREVCTSEDGVVSWVG